MVAEVTRPDLPGHVPTLAEALDACAPAHVNVEVKLLPNEPDHDPTYAMAGAVVSTITSAGAAGRVLVSSFDPEMVARLVATGLPTGQLLLGPADFADVAAAGVVAANPHHALVTEVLVRAAHAAGLAVYPWTVDDPGRIAELARWGVDGVITNVPDVARAVLDGGRPV